MPPKICIELNCDMTALPTQGSCMLFLSSLFSLILWSLSLSLPKTLQGRPGAVKPGLLLLLDLPTPGCAWDLTRCEGEDRWRQYDKCHRFRKWQQARLHLFTEFAPNRRQVAQTMACVWRKVQATLWSLAHDCWPMPSLDLHAESRCKPMQKNGCQQQVLHFKMPRKATPVAFGHSKS